MADLLTILDETETHPNFVIASEARQYSVACACSGLPRCPESLMAPRHDSYMLSSMLLLKGTTQ
jgi:hypothetical protein